MVSGRFARIARPVTPKAIPYLLSRAKGLNFERAFTSDKDADSAYSDNNRGLCHAVGLGLDQERDVATPA